MQASTCQDAGARRAAPCSLLVRVTLGTSAEGAQPALQNKRLSFETLGPCGRFCWVMVPQSIHFTQFQIPGQVEEKQNQSSVLVRNDTSGKPAFIHRNLVSQI